MARLPVDEKVMVNVDLIDEAPFNPPGRVLSKRIQKLVTSIEKRGIIMPLTGYYAGKRISLIDGHRRLASARAAGLTEVPMVIRKVRDEQEAKEIYAEVNSTSSKIGGNESLAIWLTEPGAVTESARVKFEQMERVVGRDMIQTVVDNGFSVDVFVHATRLTRYCSPAADGRRANEFTRKAVSWLMESCSSQFARKAMSAGQSPRVLATAINNNKPLIFRVSVS